MKKTYTLLALVLCLAMLPFTALAKEGATLVTLREGLTPREKEVILKELDLSEDADYVTVPNKERYDYLGDTLSAKGIGNKAISCAIVRYTPEGSGIHVKLSPLVKVIKEDTYRNALITAGIKDVDIYVTAPGNVSGSAALTGLFKSYERKTGKKIPEDVKEVANKEIVVASSLTEEVRENQANGFMSSVKIQMAEKMPQSEAEVRDIIQNIESQYNINLSEGQKTRVVNLFNNMKNTNIDWDNIKEQTGKYSQEAKDYINSEEGQENLKKVKGLSQRFIDWIFSLFDKSSQEG